jgi:hypothetical protein
LAERFAILCAATNWTGPARVARELVRHGAEVCIVAPPDSIVALTRYKTADLLLPLDEINRTLPGVLQVLAEQFGARTVLAGDTAAFLLLAHLMSAASRLKLDSKTEAMLRRSMGLVVMTAVAMPHEPRGLELHRAQPVVTPDVLHQAQAVVAHRRLGRAERVLVDVAEGVAHADLAMGPAQPAVVKQHGPRRGDQPRRCRASAQGLQR